MTVTQTEITELNDRVLAKVKALSESSAGSQFNYAVRYAEYKEHKTTASVTRLRGQKKDREYTAFILDTETGKFLKGRVLVSGDVKLATTQPKQLQTIHNYQLDTMGRIEGYASRGALT